MEIIDEDDGGVTIVTNSEIEIAEPQLRYISPSSDPVFVGDLCIKDGNDYIRFGLNRNQMVNLITVGWRLLKEFDKRPIEDIEVE